VLRLTERFLKEPRHVKVAGKLVSPEKTVELYYPVPFRQRFGALCRLIDAAPDMYGIVFCQTKAQTDEVGTQLTDAGYPAATLHGDMTQSERERVMRSFRAKKARVLVATDVAARGLDVDNLSHVINYSLPWDIESYIHRIGRTGRAGREGVAITFIDPREEGRIRRVETVTRKRMTRSRVPGVDQVIAAHVERLKGEFEDALKSAEPFERFIAQMAPLAENRSPQELLRGFATLLCRELFERYEDEKELGGPGAFDGAYGSPAGADGEQVEVYISAGSRNGTTPASLVAALCKTAGLDARQIGRISIKEKASFVILDKAAAQKAIESLDKTYLGGHRIKASLARGPGGPAGPGGPGGPERPARFAGPGRPGPKRARPTERPPGDADDEDSPGAEDADGSGDAETAAAPPPPRPEGDDRQYTKDEAGPGGPSAPPRKPFKKFAPDGKPGFKPRGFGGPPKFTAAGGGRPFGKPKFGKPKFAKPPAPGGPGLMKPIKTDKPKKPKKPKVDEGPSEGKE
jgi:ATP-dependent RNA helicase DeaD